jgi:hypothetical protein
MNCTTHQIESMLLAEIADVCPELGAQLHADASLTGELGLDSLCLTSLFGMVKREIGQVELSCWFIRASNTRHRHHREPRSLPRRAGLPAPRGLSASLLRGSAPHFLLASALPPPLPLPRFRTLSR